MFILIFEVGSNKAASIIPINKQKAAKCLTAFCFYCFMNFLEIVETFSIDIK